MKKELPRVSIVFSIGILIAGLVACGGGVGGGDSTTTNKIAPSITSHPQDTAVVEGQTATFSVTATGSPPFSYAWKKNGADIGCNSERYTTPAATLGDNHSTFSVMVTNPAGRAIAGKLLSL